MKDLSRSIVASFGVEWKTYFSVATPAGHSCLFPNCFRQEPTLLDQVWTILDIPTRTEDSTPTRVLARPKLKSDDENEEAACDIFRR